jgi:hypothetical protein
MTDQILQLPNSNSKYQGFESSPGYQKREKEKTGKKVFKDV